MRSLNYQSLTRRNQEVILSHPLKLHSLLQGSDYRPLEDVRRITPGIEKVKNIFKK
jgi:hypothetical protein